MANNINKGGFRSSVSMKNILQLTQQVYEPLSKQHFNDSSLEHSSKTDKSDMRQNVSGRSLNGQIYKNLYSKNTGEIVNQIYYSNSVMKEKTKHRSLK